MKFVKWIVFVLGAMLFLGNSQARAQETRGPATASRIDELLKHKATTRPFNYGPLTTQPSFKLTPAPRFDFGLEPRHTPMLPLMKKEENKWTSPLMVRWYILCAVILIALGRK